MPGFKTHITGSTIVGMGYGVVGHFLLGISPSVSVVSAGLCSIGGILPDVDSDNGQPVREVMGFSAAVIPWLLMDHFRQAGLNHDQLILAAGSVYVLIRFGFGEVLRRYTVHRGMWHSIPAAFIVGLVTSFICACDEPTNRMYKVGGVVLGYLVHLTLDEIYSVDWDRGRPRFKKSFGTALKLWGPDPWTNVAVFAKLALLVYLTAQDPMMRQESNSPNLVAPPRDAKHWPNSNELEFR